jgi:hypothetical protein
VRAATPRSAIAARRPHAERRHAAARPELAHAKLPLPIQSLNDSIDFCYTRSLGGKDPLDRAFSSPGPPQQTVICLFLRNFICRPEAWWQFCHSGLLITLFGFNMVFVRLEWSRAVRFPYGGTTLTAKTRSGQKIAE